MARRQRTPDYTPQQHQAHIIRWLTGGFAAFAVLGIKPALELLGWI